MGPGAVHPTLRLNLHRRRAGSPVVAVSVLIHAGIPPSFPTVAKGSKPMRSLSAAILLLFGSAACAADGFDEAWQAAFAEAEKQALDPEHERRLDAYFKTTGTALAESCGEDLQRPAEVRAIVRFEQGNPLQVRAQGTDAAAEECVKTAFDAYPPPAPAQGDAVFAYTLHLGH
jgi:hypothetical protein